MLLIFVLSRLLIFRERAAHFFVSGLLISGLLMSGLLMSELLMSGLLIEACPVSSPLIWAGLLAVMIQCQYSYVFAHDG